MKSAFRIKYAIGALVMLSLVSAIAMPSDATAASSNLIEEANKSFTYLGKPIHPFLMQKMQNWLSDDRPPITIAVDVKAAYDTNEFSNDSIKTEEGWYRAEREEEYGDVREYEMCSYKWHGKLGDKLHVVEFGSSGGGSGFFMDLLLVQFREGTISREGKIEDQLVMEIKGTYSLGDRYDGEIKVYPDRIVIPKSADQRGGGSTDKEVILKITDQGLVETTPS